MGVRPIGVSIPNLAFVVMVNANSRHSAALTFFSGILLVTRYTRQKLRLNKEEFAEVQLLHLFMNRRSTLPLLCTATLLLVPLAISGRAQLAGKGEARLVAFQDPDPNSGVVDDSADYDVFYDRLSPDGHWFYDDDYGYVWQPNVAITDSSWRPYADGHWVWTDRGWCWVSNENFGWATYHYGRWIRVSDVGWVWVPGNEWAPAWVSWRHTDDDDYVGWAPLPPESSVNVSFGVQPWCDSYYDIGPAAFAFIRIGDFCRPSYGDFIVPAQQNFTIIHRTQNITNISYNNNIFYNYGPQYARISQLMQRQGQKVPNYKINYAVPTDPKAKFRAQAQGSQLNVIAPPQKLKAVAKAEPQVAKQLGKAQVDRGWHNVPPNQAQQIRQKFAQEAPVPETLPFKAPLPAKPQIQAAKTNQQGQPGKPGTVPPAPATRPRMTTEKGANKTVTEQQKAEAQKTQAEREKELNQMPPAQGAQANKEAEAHKGASEKAKTLQAEKGHPTEQIVKRPEARKQTTEHPHPNATTNAQPAHHVENGSKPHLEQTSHPAPQHIAQQPHPQPQHLAQAPHPQAPHQQPQHVAQASHPQPQHAKAEKKDKKKEQ